MRTTTAAAIASLFVLASIGGGLAIARIGRPAAPTPRVVTFTPAPSPTPTPYDDVALLRQPLSAGCATAQSVWVVTDGGGLLRFDGARWELADSTLRSLLDAMCDDSSVYAVGPAGAVLQVDERGHSIRAIDVTTQDLFAIVPLPDGALAAGSQGTVMRLSDGDWQPYARGIDEDLYAIVALSGQSGWVAGAGGVSYRLDAAGWRAVPTGTDSSLRALVGPVSEPVVVGDNGVVLWWQGRWRAVPTGVDVTLRAVARLGMVAWIGGDAGTVLRVSLGASPVVAPVDLGTKCAVRGVFVRGQEVWFVASDGARGAVWRLAADRLEHWGAC